jgi:hypothetical protein
MRRSPMTTATHLRRWITAAVAVLAISSAAAAPPSKAAAGKMVFKDVKTQTQEFIGYADMSLAPEQQKVKDDVLSAIPTVCCKKFSMKTCCCPCNMAMTIWGTLELHARGEGRRRGPAEDGRPRLGEVHWACRVHR